MSRDFSVGFLEGKRNADGEQVLLLYDIDIQGLKNMMGPGKAGPAYAFTYNTFQPVSEV